MPVLLMTTVMVLAALGGGTSPQRHETSSARALRSAPVPLGSRAKPIPIGRPAAIGGGWRMRVLLATPNATSQVLATKGSDGNPVNSPPPPGAQDFMVRLALTYLGKGKDDSALVVDYRLGAMGIHNRRYTAANTCGQWPEPSLQYTRTVLSGETVQGNVCFRIAANDAKTLRLYAADRPRQPRQVWFALR